MTSEGSTLDTDDSYRVGILGATGVVGQRFVQLLSGHKWFRITSLGASERSSGKKYGELVKWRFSTSLSDEISQLVLTECDPELFLNKCDLIFSALDASVAGGIEDLFASKGLPVFSNAKNHRTNPLVPILIPFVNSDHIWIVKEQPSFKTSGGFIITNANCAVTGLCIALKPIHDKFGIKSMVVTTLQAVSGAGYPGLPSLDILDNAIPYICGEEEKVESEPNKILGTYVSGTGIENAKIAVSAMCHRVAVSDGHLVSVSLLLQSSELSGYDTIAGVEGVLRESVYSADVLKLPSSPEHPIRVLGEMDRPQPRLDRDTGNGMTTSIGRIRPCGVFDVRMSIISHNTIVGAAGGSVLNAELAVDKKLIRRRCS